MDQQYSYNIDLDTFIIPHDKDRDYRGRDKNNLDMYVPPYDHYKYKSIYEGIMIEMHLVDHCNLNCVSCNHFSPLAKPWFITKESLQNSLTLVKENIPNVKNLILLGGEPTLHPELLELCKIARNIMPKDVEICVMSNGKNLTQVLQDAEQYKNLKVYFSICDYPTHTNKSQVQEAIDKGIASYVNTRLLMCSSLVNEQDHIEDPIANFYNCSHHMLPCFTVEEDKLFVCPFASHSKHYFKKCKQDYPITEFDYLKIADIQNDIELLQDFIFTPKPICAYCRHESELREFKKSTRTIQEYNSTMSELYWHNYPQYEALMQPQKEYFIKCLQNQNTDYLRLEDNDSKTINNLKNRYGSGKIDIIIPYYHLDQSQIEQLEQTLLSQSIIDDCVIYMISDGSPNEKEVFTKFYYHTKLNCVMLKNIERQGPGVARNKGLAFSCNDYIFMLDADDYFAAPDALEYLYNLAKGRHKDVIYFKMHDDDEAVAQLSNKSNFLLRRQLLDNHSDIKFPPYFFGEDFWFMNELHKYTNNNNCLTIDRPIAWYGTRNSNQRLTTETDFTIPLILSKLLFATQHPSDFIKIFGKTFVKDHKKYLINKKDEYIRILTFYIFYQIYHIQPELLDDIDVSYLIDLQNNIIAVPTKNKILRNIDEIKEYLYINLNTDNIFIKPLSLDLQLVDFYKK